MKTYTVYLSPKKGVTSEQLLKDAHEFGVVLQNAGLIEFFVLHEVTNSGNFEELPQLSMASFFRDQSHLDHSMAEISKHYFHHPLHRSLMASVADFKVSFTDVVLPEQALEAS